jgi:hypothetical protein
MALGENIRKMKSKFNLLLIFPTFSPRACGGWIQTLELWSSANCATFADNRTSGFKR